MNTPKFFRAWDLKFLDNVYCPLCVTCSMLHIMSPVSCVKCFFHIFFELVGEGSVISGAISSRFYYILTVLVY